MEFLITVFTGLTAVAVIVQVGFLIWDRFPWSLQTRRKRRERELVGTCQIEANDGTGWVVIGTDVKCLVDAPIDIDEPADFGTRSFSSLVGVESPTHVRHVYWRISLPVECGVLPGRSYTIRIDPYIYNVERILGPHTGEELRLLLTSRNGPYYKMGTSESNADESSYERP